jgi:hypothetical protein
MTRITLQKARAAKATLLKQFRRLPNVTGIGIAKVGADYAVKINLSEPMAEGTRLPAEIEGVPITIEVTGAITKRVKEH